MHYRRAEQSSFTTSRGFLHRTTHCTTVHPYNLRIISVNSSTCLAHFNLPHHAMSTGIFSSVPTSLFARTFSFVAIWWSPLTPAYDGPFTVVARSPKTITIDINGTTNVVSVNRVKPAYLDATLHCTVMDTGFSRPEATSSPQKSMPSARPTKEFPGLHRLSCAPVRLTSRGVSSDD